ncbi:hypothetical protein [Nocardia sp. NPDC004860]|uniref:hypothetical protein n=1 Tax=Nocardia sp. NPDC004860 TaxID=3154557 RepID=UPI0033BAE788
MRWLTRLLDRFDRYNDVQAHMSDGRILRLRDLPPEDRERVKKVLAKYRRRRR